MVSHSGKLAVAGGLTSIVGGACTAKGISSLAESFKDSSSFICANYDVGSINPMSNLDIIACQASFFFDTLNSSPIDTYLVAGGALALVGGLAMLYNGIRTRV